MLLALMEGATMTELKDLMGGVPGSILKKRLYRCRLALKQILREEFGVEI